MILLKFNLRVIRLAHPTPALTMTETRSTLLLPMALEVSITSNRISTSMELWLQPSLCMRTSSPTRAEFTRTRADRHSVDTLSSSLAGELKVAKTTGLQLIPGTTLGETRAPSRLSKVSAESTDRSTLVLPPESIRDSKCKCGRIKFEFRFERTPHLLSQVHT